MRAIILGLMLILSAAAGVHAGDRWFIWTPGGYTNSTHTGTTIAYLGATNLDTSSSWTNSANSSTAWKVPDGVTKVRAYWGYSTSASSTNANGATLYLSAGSYGIDGSAVNTITYDTALQSLFQLTTSGAGSAGTYAVSDLFDLSGVRWLKPTFTTNNLGGTMTNKYFAICITNTDD